MVKRVFVAILFFMLLCPGAGMAQRTIGIDWQMPDDASEAIADLQYFSDLGITHLQINRMPDAGIWQEINERQLRVFGRLPISFAVTQTFSATDSSFIDSMREYVRRYDEQPSLRGIGIFLIGAQYSDSFRESVTEFTENLGSITDKPFYYVTPHRDWPPMDGFFEFSIIHGGHPPQSLIPEAEGYVYHPSSGQEWNLAAVKSFLEKTGNHPDKPVFFDSSWLKNMTGKHADFDEIIKLYATSESPAFPLPRQADEGVNSQTIIVVMLLLAWLIFASIYSYNPVYRRSFMRYFTGHTFFVDDVMERHIRAQFTGFAVLIQHAIAGGILVYCLSHVLLSPLGYEALHTHYPVITLFGSGAFGLFIWGFLLTLAIEALSVIWIWGVNPAATHISQIINLYPWPLQLNLIITTLIAGFYLAGKNQSIIYLLSIVFLLLFLSAFFITALDTGRHNRTKRIWVYAGTLGGYSILLIAILLWGFLSPKFLNVIELAGRLP